MSDIYVALIYLSFIVLGFTAPFVATLGYVWTDTFYPQLMSTIVAMVPSSMVMGGLAIGLYVAMDRRAPRVTAHTVITLCFGLWCTVTMTWADMPAAGWEKWDWAFKTVMFSAFIPLAIRSRVQIEAFVQVYLAAVMIHIIPVGVKTMMSGSAYGRGLGVIRGNVGLAESSALASISIAMIPLIFYLRRYSVLVPDGRLRKLTYLGLALVSIPAAIGTYARTALVGFVVVGGGMFLQSRRKILYVACVVMLGFAMVTYSGSDWLQRMDTTTDYENESSAYGRILVWTWTLGYVTEHPLGGGFNNFLANVITTTDSNNRTQVIYGKAYHSMYFEVLGEQGIPGIVMFGGLLGMSIVSLLRIIRKSRGQPHLEWARELAKALLTALLTVMACGAFIGIGFQAYIWYLITLPICLREYLVRVDRLEESAAEQQRTQLRGGGPRRAALPAGPQRD